MGEAGLKQRLNSSAASVVDAKETVALGKVAALQAAEEQRTLKQQWLAASQLPATFVNMFLLNDGGPGNLRLTFGDQFNMATPPVMRAQLLMDLNMFKQMTKNCVQVVEQIEATEKVNARLQASREATSVSDVEKSH